MLMFASVFNVFRKKMTALLVICWSNRPARARQLFRPQMVMPTASALMPTPACLSLRHHSKIKRPSPAWWCQLPTSWSTLSLSMFTVSLKLAYNTKTVLQVFESEGRTVFIQTTCCYHPHIIILPNDIHGIHPFIHWWQWLCSSAVTIHTPKAQHLGGVLVNCRGQGLNH